MGTELKKLSSEFNFARMRLKGIEGSLKNIATLAGVKIPEDRFMMFRLIDLNLQREYKRRKGELLGIPEGKVKIRNNRPDQPSGIDKFRTKKYMDRNWEN